MWPRNNVPMKIVWNPSGVFRSVFRGGFRTIYFQKPPDFRRDILTGPHGSLLKNILPSIGVIGEFISLMEVSKAMAERSNVVGG